MASGGPGVVRFTLNGRPLELTRGTVESRLRGEAPEPIHKHAVRINDTWWPVMQAFEVATGVPRSRFISHTARRQLAALGFEVRGEIEPRITPSSPAGSAGSAGVAVPAGSSAATAEGGVGPSYSAGEEWHTEAHVQAALVAALVGSGWRILSVANTASKEHGIDVVAERDGETVGVEVKGFPSRGYADPARAGEVKRTTPSTQAGHWFAQAVLAAMRLRGKRPGWRSVMALPDFARYRTLYAETAGSLAAAGIAVWWVRPDGRVEESG